MFARTERLLLRPGWIEDAPALARTIATQDAASCSPWPTDAAAAERMLAQTLDTRLPPLLVQLRTDGAPRLIGSARIRACEQRSGEAELWIAPAFRGRGYGSEAARALLDMARFAAGIRTLRTTVVAGDAAAFSLCRALGFSLSWPASGTRDDSDMLFIRRLDMSRELEDTAIAA